MKSIVKQYFEEHDFAYESFYDEERDINIFSTNVVLDCGNIPIKIIIEADPKRTSIIAFCPLSIPTPHRVKVSEFITRVNYDLATGHFILDFNDGEIAFQYSFLYEEEPSHAKGNLEMTVYISLANLETYLPGILSIVYGEKSPSEAISDIEFSTNPKLN